MNKGLYDKYVLCIVENGSLTRAAEILGLTQPAISFGVKALEKEIGIKIFNRKKLPMELTKEGELYIAHLKKQRSLEADFQKRLSDLRENDSKEYRVGGPVAYVESMITKAAVRLAKDKPEFRAVIKSAPFSNLLLLAGRGEIDCFVCTTENIPENFEKKLIKHERIYLVINKDMEINDRIKSSVGKKSGKAMTFDYRLLDGEDFIFLEDGQPLQKQMNAFFSQYNIRPHNRYVVNQVSSALNLAINGGGICFASEASLECRSDLEGACVYALPDSVVGRNIYVAYDSGMFMSEACKEFIDNLIAGGNKNE